MNTEANGHSTTYRRHRATTTTYLGNTIHILHEIQQSLAFKNSKLFFSITTLRTKQTFSKLHARTFVWCTKICLIQLRVSKESTYYNGTRGETAVSTSYFCLR